MSTIPHNTSLIVVTLIHKTALKPAKIPSWSHPAARRHEYYLPLLDHLMNGLNVTVVRRAVFMCLQLNTLYTFDDVTFPKAILVVVEPHFDDYRSPGILL